MRCSLKCVWCVWLCKQLHKLWSRHIAEGNGQDHRSSLVHVFCPSVCRYICFVCAHEKLLHSTIARTEMFNCNMNSACGWHLVDSSCFCELDFGRKDYPSQHHNRRLKRHCMEEQMLSHDGVLLLFLFHLYEVYLCLTLCNWTCSWRLYLERNHTQYYVFKLKFTTGSIETGSLASLSEWVVLCWRIISNMMCWIWALL